MDKFIIIDRTDPYHTYASVVEGENVMLESIQEKEPDDIEVWKVSKKVNLVKRPSVVLADDS